MDKLGAERLNVVSYAAERQSLELNPYLLDAKYSSPCFLLPIIFGLELVKAK